MAAGVVTQMCCDDHPSLLTVIPSPFLLKKEFHHSVGIEFMEGLLASRSKVDHKRILGGS